MVLNIPKMWTFEHTKKDNPSCGAVFQVMDASIDATGMVQCPNCGEKFSVSDALVAFSSYKKIFNGLRSNGLRVYPPEAEIEAFETHIAHMKSKEGEI